MDDSAKNISSYQIDQEILDGWRMPVFPSINKCEMDLRKENSVPLDNARGIDMTVEEVAGLSTCKYSERVQSLKVNDEDLAFLKGLRRRIKNRLASQNSRRRSVEHLRRLARELRAVRACRDDALSERRALVTQRDAVRERCTRLRRYIVQILQDRLDNSEIPSIDVEITQLESPKTPPKIVTVTETKTPLLSECFGSIHKNIIENTEVKDFGSPEAKIFEDTNSKSSDVKDFESTDTKKCHNTEAKIFQNTDSKNLQSTEEKIFEGTHSKIFGNATKTIFECRIDKLVQQSVNHIFKNDADKKKVFAKTVFISNEKLSSDIKSMVLCESEMKILENDDGVLNLSLKEGRRKSHGRKQLAPRRIAYVYADANDGVLDLKINKE